MPLSGDSAENVNAERSSEGLAGTSEKVGVQKLVYPSVEFAVRQEKSGTSIYRQLA